MHEKRTLTGWEVCLTPTGVGRWGGALFLAAWLLFWVVGEALAGWILVRGAWALATGEPPQPGAEPLALAPTLLAGLFLLGWLAFWTLGGVLAGAEFFRLVWSSDRFLVSADGVERRRWVGPLFSKRWWPRESWSGVYPLEGKPVVMAEIAGEGVELTRNGSQAEQARLVEGLRQALRLRLEAGLPRNPPGKWRVLRVPEGGEVVVYHPEGRQRRALALAAVGSLLGLVAVVVGTEAMQQPNYAVVAVMLVGATVLVAWSAARLARTRTEWRLERGRLWLQRRVGGRVKTAEAFTQLRLQDTRDDDGDLRFHLEAGNEAGRWQQVTQVAADAREPRRLGEWLAGRVALPLVDESTAEARARRAEEAAATRAEAWAHVREWFRNWWRGRLGRDGES